MKKLLLIFILLFLPLNIKAAMEFDYSTGQATIVSADSALNPANITMVAYVKPDGIPTSGVGSYILCKHYTTHVNPYYQYRMYFIDSTPEPNHFLVSVAVGGSLYHAYANNVYTDNEWVWAIATYDGETLKAYMDTTLIATNTNPSGDINSYDTDLILGGFKDYTTPTLRYSFDGIVAEFRIYNRALSIHEINAIVYGDGSDNIVNGLNGRWLVNEKPAGTVASGAGINIDVSGSGNDGTPENSPVYRVAPLKTKQLRISM